MSPSPPSGTRPSGRDAIDGLWQHLRQLLGRILLRHAELRGNLRQDVEAEHAAKLIGADRHVLAA